jgi:hypothetical protein
VIFAISLIDDFAKATIYIMCGCSIYVVSLTMIFPFSESILINMELFDKMILEV